MLIPMQRRASWSSNAAFLRAGGTPAEYRAGLERAVAKGWLWRHETGVYVKFTRPAPSCLPERGWHDGPNVRGSRRSQWKHWTLQRGRTLSTASAGGGVIQPIPGLFVGPTRDGEARGGRHTLAGTNDDMLARA